MRSSRFVKRDAAPENAKPTKNATRAAVDVRTRTICRSNGSSAVRQSEPSQKPISYAATTPAIRPVATSNSLIVSSPCAGSEDEAAVELLYRTGVHRKELGEARNIGFRRLDVMRQHKPIDCLAARRRR